MKFTKLGQMCPVCKRGPAAHLWGACQKIEPRSAASVAALRRLTQPTGPVEIYTDKAGKPRYRVRARNGRVIAPLESYSSTRAVKRGVEALRRALANPRYVDSSNTPAG